MFSLVMTSSLMPAIVLYASNGLMQERYQSRDGRALAQGSTRFEQNSARVRKRKSRGESVMRERTSVFIAQDCWEGTSGTYKKGMKGTCSKSTD